MIRNETKFTSRGTILVIIYDKDFRRITNDNELIRVRACPIITTKKNTKMRDNRGLVLVKIIKKKLFTNYYSTRLQCKLVNFQARLS